MIERYDLIDSNRHGTRCAGEVSATANNSICNVIACLWLKVGTNQSSVFRPIRANCLVQWPIRARSPLFYHWPIRAFGHILWVTKQSLSFVALTNQSSLFCNCRIGGMRMLDGDGTDAVDARSLSLNNQHIDISPPRGDLMTMVGLWMVQVWSGTLYHRVIIALCLPR